MNTEMDIPGYGQEAVSLPGNQELSKWEVIAGKLMMLIVALLICIGIVVVYSSGAGWAESTYSSSEYFLWRQLFFAFVGVLAIVFFSRLDYHIFYKVSKIFLLVSVVLLVLLLVLKLVGVISGAARWIGYGPLKFQVSDVAKYALIFHFSRMLSDRQADVKDLHVTYLPMVIILVIVVMLVALEPNFSTASLLTVIGFMMMFIGGVDIRYLLVTLSLVVPVGAVYALLAPYRVARFVSFFSGDEKHLSYQVLQALIGLGNGGFFGLGIGASKQRELYLPLSYNDFVFVVIGEEYGFIGALVVLLLFSAFLVCGLVIAKHAADNFGRFMAAGITLAITLFAFVNMAVASHLLPTTGVALPFISYGGTALVFNSLGVGILISISRYKKMRMRAESKAIGEGELS